MKCPNCNETLLMTERNNVEIDYCPACRGVWLDKGELDKLLEHAEHRYSQSSGNHRSSDQHDTHYEDYKKDQKEGKHYKKRSFLGDFFDFD